MKKGELLQDAFGEIEEQYIEESMKTPIKDRKAWWRWESIAACFFVMLFVAFAVGQQLDFGKPPVQTTTTSNRTPPVIPPISSFPVVGYWESENANENAVDENDTTTTIHLTEDATFEYLYLLPTATEAVYSMQSVSGTYTFSDTDQTLTLSYDGKTAIYALKEDTLEAKSGDTLGNFQSRSNRFPISMCSYLLNGSWADVGLVSGEAKTMIAYYFSADGYFQKIDLQSNTATPGIYSFDGRELKLYPDGESVETVLYYQDGILRSGELVFDKKSWAREDYFTNLSQWQNRPYRHVYLERLIGGGEDIVCQLPGFEIFSDIEVLKLNTYVFTTAYHAKKTFTLYRPDQSVVYEKADRFIRPSESGIYYLDLCYYGDYGDGISNGRVLHFYFALDIKGVVSEYLYKEGSRGGQDYIIITGYTGTERDLIIPSVIADAPVTEIAKKAFRGAEIDSVVIPEGVQLIREEAFAYSTLKKVTLPKSLQTVDSRAFAYTLLTEIELPTDTDVSYRFAAFGYCEQLSRVNSETNGVVCLPPLGNCDGCFYDCDLFTTVIGGGEALIIGPSAFYQCNGITRVDVTAKALNRLSFGYCTNLKEVKLGENQNKVMVWEAFKGCDQLEALYLPTKLSLLDEFFGLPKLEVIYSGTEEQWESTWLGPHNEDLFRAIREKYGYPCQVDAEPEWLTTKRALRHYVTDRQLHIIYTDGTVGTVPDILYTDANDNLRIPDFMASINGTAALWSNESYDEFFFYYSMDQGASWEKTAAFSIEEKGYHSVSFLRYCQTSDGMVYALIEVDYTDKKNSTKTDIRSFLLTSMDPSQGWSMIPLTEGVGVEFGWYDPEEDLGALYYSGVIDVMMFDQNNGYYTVSFGSYREWYETQDGGVTWNQIHFATEKEQMTYDICGIYGLDAFTLHKLSIGIMDPQALVTMGFYIRLEGVQSKNGITSAFSDTYVCSGWNYDDLYRLQNSEIIFEAGVTESDASLNYALRGCRDVLVENECVFPKS